MTGLVFAAVAPHGYLALTEAVPQNELHLGQATRDAMVELERRFNATAPDAVVILTPHHVHVEGAFAVVLSGWLAGDLADWTPQPVKLKVPTERLLARRLLENIRSQNLPVVGVSYGGNDQASATAPLDWGSLIPLWYFGGRTEPPIPVVVVCPARDLSPADHQRLGAAIAQSAAKAAARVALIASADHGHAHTTDGPYGFSPASAEYDEQICTMLRSGNLIDLLQLPPSLVSTALADSYWQLLILQGALEATHQDWRSDLLSYEVPTYFGMACAAFELP